MHVEKGTKALLLLLLQMYIGRIMPKKSLGIFYLHRDKIFSTCNIQTENNSMRVMIPTWQAVFITFNIFNIKNIGLRTEEWTAMV